MDVTHVVRTRRLVGVDGEASEPFTTQEEPHGPWVVVVILDVGHEHVEPQVELEPLKEHRSRNVLLHDALLTRSPRLAPLWVGRNLDPFALRA